MKNISRFSSGAQAYWKKQFEGHLIYSGHSFSLSVSEHLDKNSQIITLEFPDGSSQAVISPVIEEKFPGINFEKGDFKTFMNILSRQQIDLHGADYIFYFPESEKEKLIAQSFPENIRPLTQDDIQFFSDFEASAAEQDLDDAFVELEHWKIFGIFENGQLVSVASAYPWGTDTILIDMGVLTLNSFRGKGYGAKAIQAISKAIIEEGYEPQYRCQLDNEASVALAKKLNLELFAKWDIISNENSILLQQS